MAREMKDSGIEWIGKIPLEWKTIRGKVLFRQRNEKGNNICLQLLSPTQKYGVIPQSLYESLSGLKAVKLDENADYMQLKTIHKGDFCISLRSFQGGFEYTEYEGVVSPAYQVFYAYGEVSNHYYRYLFKDKTFIDKMNSYTLSLRDGKNIAFSDFANTYIPFPPIQEQKKIADYLDTECARIDAVMEQTRASIEEYKKLKQAVITQAVTKGIRPNRPMKDSGVDWIGAIPIDWECKRFKFFATVKSNLVSPDNYGDYPQISPENIEKGTGRLLPYQKVSEVGVISGNHLFYAGQILYSKIRPILNKVIIAPFDGLCSADMYPIETVLNIKFLLYALRSDSFLANIRLLTEDRVKMPKINQDELGNIFFAVPPEKEQNAIVYYLDKKNTEIDALIQKKEQLISEMEAYKKSIIFEYVTGKRGVQNE